MWTTPCGAARTGIVVWPAVTADAAAVAAATWQLAN